MRFHRIIGHPLRVFDKVMPLLDKSGIFCSIDTHEIVPCGQMAHQRFGIHTRQFFLAYRKGNDRDLFCGNTLVTQFLIEWYVGITVNGRNDGRFLAGRTEFFDIGDNTLPVGMAEWRVVDHNILLVHAFGQQISFKNLVGGAWINIVRTGQHPTLCL